ncbi:MAG TPA: hypothetical protein VEQ63_09095, partial [Bryobacteraceae bacterium]|nr:hypothetical protein [Bryobacteraceae bacterium]
ALAAGETPSPEMVAAAGEGSGLAVKFAIPLYLVVVAGIAAHVFYLQREVALDRLGTFYSPEVLEHKAREMLRSFGGNEPVADSVRGLDWNWSFFDHVKAKDKPVPDWNQILPGRPPVVKFWYRESPAPLVAGEFHDDLLTPGMVDAVDPPGILAGMRSIELDKEGRLISFFRVPPERTEGPKPPSAVDWAPFFNAAGLDPAQLRPATAKGAWLEAADLREAWSGVWPGTTRPLHVEAAAWQGQPVVFAVQGSWSTLWRTPRPPSARGQTSMLILCSLAVTTIVASSLLARRNVLRGRGDRSGAMRLAAFMFAVHMTLWLTRSHFAPSLGTFGMFLLALCTSIAYAVLVWTLYMAIEPYVRRHWPHTIISWTRVLSGRLRDPIVGRDILIGAAVSLGWRFLGHVSSALDRSNMPDFISPTLLLGARSTLGEYLENVPHAIRETLLFFFILFLFRVILRNQWAAAVAFASIFVALNIAGGGLDPVRLATASVVFLSISLLVVRFGLLALASAYLIDGTLGDMPVTFQPSQWYFFSFALLMVLTLGLVTWAFKQAVSGQKWFGEALFD